MKIVACIWISVVATLATVADSNQETKNSTGIMGLWQDGKIAYEISQKFGKKLFINKHFSSLILNNFS